VLAQMRSGMAADATMVTALAALEQAVARHYLAEAPCC
jgi:hypothetical protein